MDLLRCGNLLSYVGATRDCAPPGASIPAVFDSATIYVSDFRPIAPANMRYGAKRSRVWDLFVTSAESPPTNFTLPSGVFLFTYTILILASPDPSLLPFLSPPLLLGSTFRLTLSRLPVPTEFFSLWTWTPTTAASAIYSSGARTVACL